MLHNFHGGRGAFALSTATTAGPANDLSIRRARWQAAALLDFGSDGATEKGPRAELRQTLCEADDVRRSNDSASTAAKLNILRRLRLKPPALCVGNPLLRSILRPCSGTSLGPN